MKIAYDKYSDGNNAIKLIKGTHSVRLFDERTVQVLNKLTGEVEDRNRMTLVNDEGHEWSAWAKPDLAKVARAMGITLDQLLKSFKKDGTPTSGRLEYFEIVLVERVAKSGTVYLNIQ